MTDLLPTEPSTPPAPTPADRDHRRDRGRGRVRSEWRRAREFARRLERVEPSAPVPPPLPPGRVIDVPGIGEVFARVSAPVPGATPVLLLHGWTVTGDLNWFRCYERLTPGRQVIAIDHQGHGRGVRSEQSFSLERCADAAAGVLAELDIPAAVVAGYSMGGPIALLTAHRHPERVAGLVLGATASDWRSSRLERWQWRLLPLVELLARFTTGRGIAPRVVRQALADDPTLEVWRPWLLAEMQRGYLPDLIGAGRALSQFDARPWAATIGAPSSVVLTTGDRLVKPAKQRQLAAAVGATVHEVHGDHDVPMVGAVTFTAALLRAIDDVTV